MWKRPRVEVVTDCLPTVAVVIVTRNRGQDALAAMRSALIQQGIRLEILVYDDASEDGSTDILESVTDPAIRLFCAKHRKGYIHWRNRGFADAESEFVFSLDDDAFFSSPYTLKEMPPCSLNRIRRLLCLCLSWNHDQATLDEISIPCSLDSR
jgi:glycosyltransferase involved in cell wall biosynthesis